MKILFVGLGSIGIRHLKILKEFEEEFEFIAYRSSKDNSNIKQVEEFYDLNEALDQNPDIAFITNPTALHVEIAITCAQRGCNLFIEKPLSDNLNDIDELIKIINNKNLKSLMGCNLRFHPLLTETKKYLDDNIIGDIYSYKIFCGSYLPDWRPNKDYREVYSSKKNMGGGVTLDLIHEIDYAYWLFGRFNSLKSFSSKISKLEIETEDISEIILENENDIIGNIHLDYFRRIPRRDFEIIGEKGVILGDFLSGDLIVDTLDNNITKSFESGIGDTYKRQLEYFIDCIKNDRQCFNDIKEGKEVLKLALEAKGVI